MIAAPQQIVCVTMEFAVSVVGKTGEPVPLECNGITFKSEPQENNEQFRGIHVKPLHFFSTASRARLLVMVAIELAAALTTSKSFAQSLELTLLDDRKLTLVDDHERTYVEATLPNDRNRTLLDGYYGGATRAKQLELASLDSTLHLNSSFTRTRVALASSPPATPTGLTAVAPTCGEASLHWAAVGDTGTLRGYRVYRTGHLVVEVPASQISFVDAPLTPAETYLYAVSATDTSGNESAQSAPVAFTATSCEDTIPPTIPVGLLAVADSCTVATLSWSPSMDNGLGLRGYRVFRNGGLVIEVPASQTSVSDAPLSPGHSYTYALSAIDLAGNESALTSVVTITMPSNCEDISPPSTPDHVIATALGCGSARIVWNPSVDLGSAGIRGYRIFRSGRLLSEVPATITSFEDAPLSPSASYIYRVSAVDRAGNESILSPPIVLATPPCPPGRSDFNRDGYTDIVWQHSDGTVGFWFMYDAALLEAVAPLHLPEGWRIVGIGDFNGDTHADLVLQHTDGRVAFWLMDRTSVMQTTDPIALPLEWRVRAIGDFDHDGHDDVVLQNTDGSIAFWLMDGTNIRRGIIPYSIPPEWQIAAAGDFNHDGKSDLVLQHSDGSVGFWLMDGTTIVEASAPYQIPTSWRIAAVGAFADEEDADIALQNLDGSIALWIMDGIQIRQGVILLKIPTDWQIVGPR